MKCYLDMDGVLVDFVQGSIDLHRISPTKPYKWDYFAESGLTPAQFYAPMNREYWANLNWMPQGQELLEHLEKRFGQHNICILSSPCATDGCLDGKRDWIAKHVPQFKRRSKLGADKAFAASPWHMLIDDHDPHVSDFRKAGGFATLVPRTWNAGRGNVCPETNEFDMTKFLWDLDFQRDRMKNVRVLL
jgi:5'(3')-deoxyribonucleotidase